MHKALTVIGNDPEIKALTDLIEKERKSSEEKIMFLNKQYEDLKEQAISNAKVSWDKIEELFIARGVLPRDYTKEKYDLHISEEMDTVCISDVNENKNENHSLLFKEFLKGLMK